MAPTPTLRVRRKLEVRKMTAETPQEYRISDNIWITSKTRMHSEVRYRLYSVVSHILLSYFSVVIIVISILSEALEEKVEHLSQINTVIALFLFATSLIVYGFKFEETARLHRECYLRLQELFSSKFSEDEKIEHYNRILLAYPNHAERDYESLVVRRTLLNNADMSNSKGPVTYSVTMLISWIARGIGFWTFVAALVLIPIYLLFLPLFGSAN